MQDLDFAERPAPGIAAAMCSQCGAIKPERSFERKLTPLQARARGYVGAFDVSYTSSICHDCKPVRKRPIHELPLKELRNLHGAGKLRTYQYESELARRKQARSEAGREAVMRRWAGKYESVWTPIMDALRQETSAVRHQQKYARAKGVAGGGFFDAYLKQLEMLRLELKHRRRVLCKPPIFATWEAHFDDTLRAQLTAQWREMQRIVVGTEHSDWVLRAREPVIVGLKYPEREKGAPRRRLDVPMQERTTHMVNVDTSVYAKPTINLAQMAVTETERASRGRLSQIK